MYKQSQAPRRPGLPPVFISAVLAICAGRIIFSRSVPLVWLLCGTGVALAALVICVCVHMQRGGAPQNPLPLIAGCALFLLTTIATIFATASQDRAIELLQKTPVSKLSLEAVADATQNDYGWSLKALASKDGALLGLVRVSVSESVEAHEVIKAVGTVKQNADDEYAASLYQQGYIGQIQVSKILEKQAPVGLFGVAASVKKAALGVLKPEDSSERALIAGMCLGYKPALKSAGIQESFGEVGLSHIIAVSGAHLAIVGSVLALLLESTSLSKKMKVLLLCITCADYVLLCGAPVSAQRSWIMSVLGNLGALFGRRNSSLNSLGIAGFGLCLSNPQTCVDMGFLLSFVSVFALCLFAGMVTFTFKRMLSPLKIFADRIERSCQHALISKGTYLISKTLTWTHNRITQDGSASVVCATATAPLSSAFFGRFCLIGPLSALLVGPFIMPLMLSGLIGVCLGCVPFIGTILASVPLLLADLSAKVILAIAQLTGSVPFGTLNFTMPEPLATLALIGGAALFYVLWPSPKKHILYAGAIAIFACIFFFSSILPAASPARLVVLNIGQGDAILIQDRSRAIMVDTGVDDSVLEALAPFCVTHLDAIVITHQHADHYGGLKAILSSIPTDKVIFGRGVTASLCSAIQDALKEKSPPLKEVKANDSFQDGDWRFTCLWPKEASKGDENEDSICFKLTRTQGLFSAFLTGDAESSVLDQIDRLPQKISVYKVGHHGSAVAINASQAQILSPKLSVASAGKGNKYGHPTKQCKEILEAAGSQFVCTIDAGTVVTTPQEIGIGVYADVPEALRKK